jgi:hypothetical protein
MPDPNNIVLHDHKLVFMCIPKAANTSIKNAIQKSLGMKGDPNQLGKFDIWDKYQIHSSDYFSIAFVRNPIDRLVSCYKDKVIRKHFPAFEKHGIDHGMDFESFVEIVVSTPDIKADQHFRSQAHELLIDDEIVPDYIGNVENIYNDWQTVKTLCPTLNLPDLPFDNVSGFDISIDDTIKDKIYKRYKRDFEIFNYESC